MADTFKPFLPKLKTSYLFNEDKDLANEYKPLEEFKTEVNGDLMLKGIDKENGNGDDEQTSWNLGYRQLGLDTQGGRRRAATITMMENPGNRTVVSWAKVPKAAHDEQKSWNSMCSCA